jgi:hypothetical protein|tara:strand:- start:11102 stop:11668 length:567 start_codon:yes stop_codon:yes gene_type:complete
MGKLKSNFINRNSFNVGFNNRSPLNQYKSTMPTSFDLPKLDGAKVGKHIADGAQAISNAKLKSGEAINQSIVGATEEIAKSITKNKEAEKDLKNNEKLEFEAGVEENREYETREAMIENMPAFVENWRKENPGYNMDDFKKKYGEEWNEHLKRNNFKQPEYTPEAKANLYLESKAGNDMMNILKNIKL